MRSITVKRGDIIFKEGSISDMFYVIKTGRFEVSKVDSMGHMRIIDTLGPNQFFGEVGVLTGKPRTETITALGPGELSVLLPDEFESILGKRPETLRPLLRIMAKRVRDSLPQVE